MFCTRSSLPKSILWVAFFLCGLVTSTTVCTSFYGTQKSDFSVFFPFSLFLHAPRRTRRRGWVCKKRLSAKLVLPLFLKVGGEYNYTQLARGEICQTIVCSLKNKRGAISKMCGKSKRAPSQTVQKEYSDLCTSWNIWAKIVFFI